MIPKLKTRREIEEKAKRKSLLMTIFVIVILGASTAGYAFMDSYSAEKRKYNGFTFIQIENGWQLKNTNLITRYLPWDVENITISGNPMLDDFRGQGYFIALDNDERLAAAELINKLPLQKANRACLPKDENEEFCSDIPIKSCDDAGSGNVVVIFERSEENSASYAHGCLEVKGSSEFMLKSADKMLFMLYGVM